MIKKLQEDCRSQQEYTLAICEEVESLRTKFKKQQDQMENYINDMNKKLEELRKSQIIATEAAKTTITDLTKTISKLQLQILNSTMKVKDVTMKLDLFEVKLFQSSDVFIWMVHDMAKKRKENGIVLSEYFYSHRDGYKMWLCMFAGGTGVFQGTHISFTFQVFPGEDNAKHPLPFKKTLSVGIVDQDLGVVGKVVSIECVMEEKKTSKTFNFQYAELDKFAAIKNDSMIVWCDL